MKRYLINTISFLFIFLSICSIVNGQTNDKISTLDFVQILNKNNAEAIFYYENNWKVLREMAVNKGFIESFQILETSATDEAPFHLILITTYSDNEQYIHREENFTKLMNTGNGLKLMNNKKPGEFRKTLFSKEMVKHLD